MVYHPIQEIFYPEIDLRLILGRKKLSIHPLLKLQPSSNLEVQSTFHPTPNLAVEFHQMVRVGGGGAQTWTNFKWGQSFWEVSPASEHYLKPELQPFMI